MRPVPGSAVTPDSARPALSTACSTTPVDDVDDDGQDGERQPELPADDDGEHRPDDGRDDGPPLPGPHPRVAEKMQQVAQVLADALLRRLFPERSDHGLSGR